MTLAEFIDYICTLTGQVTEEDRAACRSFVSKRYELIYNQFLWKDSLIREEISVDPVNNQDNADGVVLCPEVIDRVVAVRTNNGTVPIRGLEDYFRVDLDKFPLTGCIGEGALLSPVWVIWRGTVGLKIVSASSDDTDPTTKIKVTWLDNDGVRHVDLIELNSVTPPELDSPKIEIESVFKPATNAGITFSSQTVSEAGAGVLDTTETRSPAYQRIRLFSKPTRAITLNVLGKKKFSPLTFDQEEPAIKNLDNCLIAFGSAEMLKRARQYGKAQQQLSEAAILLKALAELETVQAANTQRIQPTDGFGIWWNPRTNTGYGF